MLYSMLLFLFLYFFLALTMVKGYATIIKKSHDFLIKNQKCALRMGLI